MTVTNVAMSMPHTPTPVSPCRIRSKWTTGQSGKAFPLNQVGDPTHLVHEDNANRNPAGAKGTTTCPVGVTTCPAGLESSRNALSGVVESDDKGAHQPVAATAGDLTRLACLWSQQELCGRRPAKIDPFTWACREPNLDSFLLYVRLKQLPKVLPSARQSSNSNRS